MGGLLVLALIAGYVWITSIVCKCVRPYWGKALVIIIAILIPTADGIYGRIKLKQMCKTEGGLHIYRVVEGVEGFYYPKFSPDKFWLSKAGYKFVEGKDNTRLSLQPDGTYLLQKDVVPISKYVYDFHNTGDPLKDIFNRTDFFIRARDTGEIMGNLIYINYAGGWFERFIAGLYAARGSGGSCGSDIDPVSGLVTTVLKPIHTTSTK